MSITCKLIPESNFIRRFNWEQKRYRLRKGMNIAFSSGQVVHIDLFDHMKRKEREAQCENARKDGKEATSPRCRLQPPYLDLKPGLFYRFRQALPLV